MSHFVFSTLTDSVNYPVYCKVTKDHSRILKDIFIKGGANLAAAKGEIITPRGFVTEVTDEELAALEENEVFQLHKTNGFITVEKKRHAVEKVVENMEPRDQVSPAIPADFKKDKKSVNKIVASRLRDDNTSKPKL